MRIKHLILVFILLFSAVPHAHAMGSGPRESGDIFMPDGDGVRIAVWAENLQIPWSLIFLKDGRALVSERPGSIRLIRNGVLQQNPYAKLTVAHAGEAGLMGLAVHPDFPQMPFIYAMHTYEKGGELYNRVIRLRDNGDIGTFDRTIIDNIPGGRFHDGGRIGFGPDRMLYITTGETFKSELAQDIKSLGGKILRLTPEGTVPPDNPFKGSPVYSYGHRNPQGITWHPARKTLFASEHGPSGEFLKFGNDEVNIIVKGGNYGWPEVIGAKGKKPYIDPLVLWEKTTPPSGMTFYSGDLMSHLKDDLFVATLRSQALMRIRLDANAGKVVRTERWFASDFKKGKYGRLRDVVEGPDGALYFLTSNRDGRGDPTPGDDRIYRIMPK